MPAPLFLSVFAELWPYLVPFLSALLAAAVGYGMARLSRAATETTKERDAAVAERKAWREGVGRQLAENKAAIADERTDRTKWEWENATDLERMVGILKEFVEVQRLLAVVATTSQHHAAEITNLNRRMDDTTKHLNDFILRHVKSPA